MSNFQQGAEYSTSLLSIDLNAVVENYKILQTKTKKKVSAVVKADGYGLGAIPVCESLIKAGCSVFFTAHLDEAIAIREKLPEIEIGVLNGLGANEADIYKYYNLLPTLNDLGQISAWQEFSKNNAVNNKKLKASIHFDTGMARLGLPPNEADILKLQPSRLNDFEFKYLISHMACADQPLHSLNRQQLESFELLVKQYPNANAMLAASSAVFLGKDWHFDMVRCGVALYGGAPNDDINPMQQVIKLQSKILQIREIDQMASVGYGASYIAGRKTKVATIAVGYADGYPRTVSDDTSAYYNGKKIPLLGRVSMDLITLDITDFSNLNIGSMIDLIGENNDINKLAKSAGTISYEILTSLGRRYKRKYIGG